MKKIVFPIAVLMSIVFGCSSKSDTITDEELEKLYNEIIEQESESKESDVPTWNYSSEVDRMSGDSTFYAWIQSPDLVFFDFPYEGGSTLSLGIRKMDGNYDAYIEISKGQFNSTYNSNSIEVKFDSDKPIKFRVSESSSGSAQLLFINQPSKFIEKLKNCNTLLIECEFYQHGKQLFEFNTSGLKWNH